MPDSIIYLSYLSRRLLTSRRSFVLEGREFRYFLHPHNFTWASERCVEIPIAIGYLREVAGPVLEVGNVLSHYMKVSHEVVDKYENAPGVLNVDAVDFSTANRYGLILSISTLEHLGMKEDPDVRGPSKTLAAIKNLCSLLAPSGKMIATVPLGYNPAMDQLVDDGRLFTKRLFMKRISKQNWMQTSYGDVRGTKYGTPFKYANAICIWTIEKS